jgi:transcriptional regulator with XRE-family HTH domain
MFDQAIDIKVISPHPLAVIDRDQIRGARAMMGWTAKELARRARLGLATVRRAEADHTSITEANLYAIQRAFQDVGVVFLEEDQASPGGGRGVRLRRRQ